MGNSLNPLLMTSIKFHFMFCNYERQCEIVPKSYCRIIFEMCPFLSRIYFASFPVAILTNELSLTATILHHYL